MYFTFLDITMLKYFIARTTKNPAVTFCRSVNSNFRELGTTLLYHHFGEFHR